MNADDLKDLYGSLRGSRSALPIMDAQTLFTEKKMVQSLAKLQEAYDTYQESRARLLKQDPEKQYDAKTKDGDKHIRRLKRKQEKAREIIDVFDDLIKQLDKLARREQARQPKETPQNEASPSTPKVAPKPKVESPNREDTSAKKPAAPVAPTEHNSAEQIGTPETAAETEFEIARPSSISERFLDEFQENWGDDQLAVIGRRYSFTAVESDADIHLNALYFLCHGDDSLVVQTSSDEADDAITLVNVVSKKPLRPLPRDAFVKLGVQRKVVLLLDRNSVKKPTEPLDA